MLISLLSSTRTYASNTELLKEIKATVKACTAIKNKQRRDCVLGKLASALLNLGEYDKGLAIADKQESYRARIYIDAVKPLVLARRSSTAFSIVEKLKSRYWKIQALLQIARASVEIKYQGNVLRALNKIRTLLDPKRPEWTFLADIAELYACINHPRQAGIFFNKAWKAYNNRLYSCSPTEHRGLVEIQASAGFPEVAIKHAGTVESWELFLTAVKLAKQGRNALAELAASKCSSNHRIIAYSEIAVIQAAKGQNNRAAANLERAEGFVSDNDAFFKRKNIATITMARVQVEQSLEPAIKNERNIHAVEWAELALLLVKKRRKEAKICLKKALKKVSENKEYYKQCSALLKIAEVQFAFGRLDDAQASLSHARNIFISTLPDKLTEKNQYNASSLCQIAMAQKKFGNTTAAKNTFEQAVNVVGNNQVYLLEVVESMARVGIYNLAVRTALKIKISSYRQVAYQAVAQAQGEDNEINEALAWIKSLKNIEDRASALSALSLGLKKISRK